MRICSTSENKKSEKRISITPEIAKKYINLGLEVSLIENYGLHLGYDDNQYKSFGVNIIKDEKELINKSDIIVQLALLSDDKTSLTASCLLVATKLGFDVPLDVLSNTNTPLSFSLSHSASVCVLQCVKAL